MRKVSVYLLVLMLIMQFFPQSLFAQSSIDIVNDESYEGETELKQVVLFAKEIGGEIELYEDENGEQIIQYLPDDIIVERLEDISEVTNQSDEEKYIQIRYNIDDLTIEGYVHNDHVVQLDDSKIYRDARLEENDVLESMEIDGEADSDDERLEEDEEELTPSQRVTGLALKQPVSVYTEMSRDSSVLRSYTYGQQLHYRTYNDEWHEATVYIDGNPQLGYIHTSDVGHAEFSMTGIALKDKTAVYSDTSKKSFVIRNYNKGHVLKYKAHEKDWLIATIYVDGKRQNGYFHISDVETAVSNQETLQGIGMKSPTRVYATASTDSRVLRTYSQGHILKYRTFTKDWYEATIIVKGKAETGYIPVTDVETKVLEQEQLEVVGVKSPTQVYASASRDSDVLRTYNYGRILKLRTYTTNWYEATVIINGKRQTGYVHKNDVNDLTDTLTGFGHKNPTIVYESTSESSNKLKSYKLGAKLKYRPHSHDWFQATVIVDGVKHNGYIHTNDVGPQVPFIDGYAHANPTTVYEKTAKSSKKLRSYSKGAKLKYRPYNSSWYEATVILNGKAQTGYIHKDDVGETPPSFYGYGMKSPTRVYASTSRNSKTLKSYRKGSRLQYQLHSTNWYRATVITNGKAQTGYIHKNDIGSVTDISFVNPMKTYTYDHMVKDIKDLQKAYPDLITYHVVGKSEYGRDIYAVSLGNGKATTFINGSLHAREWISTNLNMYMLENYAKAYTTNRNIQGYNARKILNDTTIWFMPMVNPDGVTLQQRGLGAFPKKDHASIIRMNGGSNNFKRWKANAKGVDVNRNFSVDWNNVKNNPKNPSHENHKGSKPFSSKEAQAVVKFVNNHKPQMTVNYHSSGRVLYWQYKQKGSRLTRDRNIARQISRMTGYQMLSAGQDPSGGGFLQWFTETHKGPSITPELSPYVGPTNVPLSRFNQIWRENQAVGLYAAQQSYNIYRGR